MAQQDPSRGKPFQSETDATVYGRTPGTDDWKRITRIGALVVLVIFVILFFFMNGDKVEVSLVVTTVTIPLVFVLILSFLLGAAVTYLLMYQRRRAVRKTRKS
jgi:uncharacterized integral membrane protein